MKNVFLAFVLLLALLMQGVAMEGEYFECIYLDLDAFDPIIAEEEAPVLKGTIRATGTIEKVEATLYDLRRLRTEKTWVWTAAEMGPASELSLDTMRRALFRGATTGEKRLTITAEGGGRAYDLLDQEIYKCGYQEQIANISADCVFACADRRAFRFNNTGMRAYWSPKSDEDVLTVTLPEGVTGEGFQVEWGARPQSLLLRYYDAAGALLLEKRAGQGDFMPIISWYDIPAEARSFSLTVPGAQIQQLLVFEQGRTPAMAQRWEPTPEKWDLMLVSTHQDDEILFFAGTIPWYSTIGREVGVVYMTNCGADRYKEALRGLWTSGLKNYPVFLGLTDGRRKSREEAFADWGGEDKIIGMLVEQIRHYRPEVVLTHDFDGEYGHFQHVATAYAVAEAVEAAADPQRYPQSAQKYGTWDTKKLYIHLWKGGEIVMDWSHPVPGFGGLTGMEIARRANDQHRSQHRVVQFSLGYRYPNDHFGLYRTTVGPDVVGGDFFENID